MLDPSPMARAATNVRTPTLGDRVVRSTCESCLISASPHSRNAKPLFHRRVRGRRRFRGVGSARGGGSC
jgi:hypothetical protein